MVKVLPINLQSNLLCTEKDNSIHLYTNQYLSFVEQSKMHTNYNKHKKLITIFSHTVFTIHKSCKGTLIVWCTQALININLLLCCHDNNTVQLQLIISLPNKRNAVFKDVWL